MIFDALKKGMQAALENQEKEEQEENVSSKSEKTEEKLRRNCFVNDFLYRYSRLWGKVVDM